LLKLLSKDSELSEKDVLLRLGEETISVEEIASVFRPEEKAMEARSDPERPISPTSTVFVDGASGIDVKTAKCCTPVPGDKIVGIVSQKGITIHMFDCPNVQSITHGQIVTAEWGDTSKEIYPVQVLVEAEDSASHAVKDIIQKAHEKSVKVAEMNTRFTDWNLTVYRVIVYIKDEVSLSELMDSWRKISGVNRVYRVREGS
jgi:GTP pyrophosphokinase